MVLVGAGNKRVFCKSCHKLLDNSKYCLINYKAYLNKVIVSVFFICIVENNDLAYFS